MDLEAPHGVPAHARQKLCKVVPIRKVPFAGISQSPLTDSNRRPPPMNFQHYVRQLHGLRVYAHVPEIPADPYDVPVSLARRLTSYNKNVTLTPSQQTAYDGAVKRSHEHGPCCCRCWRWSAFEGQAKYLITRRQFGANQIAHTWNLEDGCGGA